MNEINFTDLPSDIKKIIFKINKDRDIIEKKFNKVLEELEEFFILDKYDKYHINNLYNIDHKNDLKWINKHFPNCEYIIYYGHTYYEIKYNFEYMSYRDKIEYYKKHRQIKGVSINKDEPTDDDDDY